MTGAKVVAPDKLPNLPNLWKVSYSSLAKAAETDIHAEILLSKLISSKKAYHDTILLVNQKYGDLATAEAAAAAIKAKEAAKSRTKVRAQSTSDLPWDA